MSPFRRNAKRNAGAWSPFNPDGTLRIVLYTDPWWKRLLARLRREPLWYDMGAVPTRSIRETKR